MTLTEIIIEIICLYIFMGYWPWGLMVGLDFMNLIDFTDSMELKKNWSKEYWRERLRFYPWLLIWPVLTVGLIRDSIDF